MAYSVVFTHCMTCRAYRAIPVDKAPFCKLCRYMGEPDKWFKIHRRYLTGGKTDIQ